jgi:single-strand DNA-binding protein
MAGINKVILVGNLGADPEIRSLENGTKVASIRLATTESYRDANQQWQDRTEWHSIVLWRYNAEKAEKFMKKGSQIYVEGKLRTRQWTDQNQNTRYTTEIVGDKVMMLGKKEEGAMGEQGFQQAAATPSIPQNQTASEPTLPPTTEAEDDLPF